jgi:hypothetical protein
MTDARMRVDGSRLLGENRPGVGAPVHRDPTSTTARAAFTEG